MFGILPNGRLMGCTLMNAAVVVSSCSSCSITNWTFVTKVFSFWSIHGEERANLLLKILEKCGGEGRGWYRSYFFPLIVVTLAYIGF